MESLRLPKITRLQVLAYSRGYTLSKIASMLNVSKQYVSLIAQGKDSKTNPTRKIIAYLLGVTPDHF